MDYCEGEEGPGNERREGVWAWKRSWAFAGQIFIEQPPYASPSAGSWVYEGDEDTGTVPKGLSY